jgi:hypothetical protein
MLIAGIVAEYVERKDPVMAEFINEEVLNGLIRVADEIVLVRTAGTVQPRPQGTVVALPNDRRNRLPLGFSEVSHFS